MTIALLKCKQLMSAIRGIYNLLQRQDIAIQQRPVSVSVSIIRNEMCIETVECHRINIVSGAFTADDVNKNADFPRIGCIASAILGLYERINVPQTSCWLI